MVCVHVNQGGSCVVPCCCCFADITAKNTSQYIFASLFGTTAGVSCCAYIGQSAPLALMCFSALAYTSMYSAYRTVKSIPLPTLNSSRLQLLASRCVDAHLTHTRPEYSCSRQHEGCMSSMIAAETF